MKKVDDLSTFIGGIVYRACEESEDAPMTLAYTMYIDLMPKVGGL